VGHTNSMSSHYYTDCSYLVPLKYHYCSSHSLSTTILMS